MSAAPGREWAHLVFAAVEIVAGHGKGILEPVGHQQGTAVVDVALLYQEFDNGGGGDRIEAARGGIVEQDFGLVDHGAGNGHPPAHAARELSGGHIHGVFQFHEAESLAHAAPNLAFPQGAFFQQPVGYVVVDGKRIEQGAFLEDHADTAPQLEKIPLGERGYFFAEYPDAARIRLDQAQRQFQNDAFAGAGHSEQRFGFSLGEVERDVIQYDMILESDRDVIKNNRTRRWQLLFDERRKRGGAHLNGTRRR